MCGFALFIETNLPKPINWAPSYSTQDKNPLGLYVLNKELPKLFLPDSVKKIRKTAYEYLNEKFSSDSLVNDYNFKGTILSISEYSEIDTQSAEELCYFVSRGNCAFLSSKDFNTVFKDSLKFETYQFYSPKQDTTWVWLDNHKEKTKKYNVIGGAGNIYFSKLDTLNTKILGYQKTDSVHANFIKVKYYNGYFFLHTQPNAFSNYHLLKNDHYQYTQNLLNYIPKSNIYWLTENMNATNDNNQNESSLKYIMSQPSLKWAWQLFLIALFLFVLFKSKRKQRIIPIILKLSNTTVEFVKTIGNLYFLEGNHDNLIDKKIIYFLEKIRADYLINTSKLNNDFVQKLHLKTGKPKSDIEKIVYLIHSHRSNNKNSTQNDLIELNNAIEKII